MGVKKENDGRYSVGMGVQNGNDYKGSQGWRDIFIQLTADGATEDSIEKLEFLRDYAIYHSGEGNPVMPPSVNVWISNNGTTTAVEADDIAYTDGVYTICGIKYSGDSWDFSNAGQGGGGGGGLPAYTSADAGKVLTVGEDAGETQIVVPEQTVTTSGTFMAAADLEGVSVEIPPSVITVTLDGVVYKGIEYDSENGIYNVQDGAGTVCQITTGSLWQLVKPEGTYTISAVIVVTPPSVAPTWANMISVLPVNEEVYAKIATVMQTAIPAAIAAGLGVPYYVPVVMGAMVDTDGWDSYTELLKQTVANKGAFVIDNDGSLHYPIFASYKESESDSIKKVGQVHFLMTYVVNGYMVDVHMIMATNMNVETKQFGIGGWLTLVDAPSNNQGGGQS